MTQVYEDEAAHCKKKETPPTFGRVKFDPESKFVIFTAIKVVWFENVEKSGVPGCQDEFISRME